MSDPFVGQLSLVGFNFAPRGWSTAAGQLLSISQNTALFSLLGTNYGGNGISNFGLPNLQGNVAIGFGQGPGLGDYNLGETSGSQAVTLLSSETPLHNHSLNTAGAAAKENTPQNNALGDAKSAGGSLYSPTNNPTPMSPSAVSIYGGGLPHNNMMPYQSLLWIIALVGVFPSRN